MSFFSRLREIYIKINVQDKPVFTVERSKQQKYLRKIGEPQNDIERGYKQYQCQMFLSGKRQIIYYIAAPILLLIKVMWCKRMKKIKEEKQDLVCLLSGINRNMVPKELIGEYKTVKCCHPSEQEILTRDDVRWYVKNVWCKYPISFFFHLKNIERLSQYSYVIKKYNPSAIAIHDEYSCTSSVMTAYCNWKNVKHINFMHGEKLWYIRDSFFHYNLCYVWDDHYVRLFQSLRAEPNQFRIAIPPQFSINENDYDTKITYDYCYYLAGENNEEVENIFKLLSLLAKKGNKIKVRMHPRWTNRDFCVEMAKKYDVEIEPLERDIIVSILSVCNVISLYSTVINQAHYMGRKIVIDDVTSVEKYNILKELDYIGFRFAHSLMSSLL